ncbi:DegT/DnrJ/EryC1/StrS family aminotransferase [Microbacterium sp. F1-18]|uniref:DegT/DnrJ/EryC1/StrS family aminotransferase n=1 Tax=unclassified Microbacterium TaxID=2609290 RepID=UPI002620F1BE|nr:DegT/DnrJ/EryC1/StrS family aminotransferase [Microbacterium sp.]MDF2562549.1 aspartate aminotransferase [Microbacterium sp.]
MSSTSTPGSERPLLENRYVNVGDAERQAVLAALETRQLAGTAASVAEYEAALGSYFGRTAIAVSSGTSALHALLITAGISSGDEVILPPTAPVMSLLPVIAVGAVPVFADIEASTFGLDPLAVSAVLSPRTKAVVTVPMWGYPANSSRLRQLADDAGVFFIEDVSHCHGSVEAGARMGTIGHAAFFSTQERKLIATGEGGFILTEQPHLIAGLRAVRDFGKLQQDAPGQPGTAGSYGHDFGLNFRISALGAALGIPQLNRLDAKIEERTRNARFITDELARLGVPLHEWEARALGIPNYYSLVLRRDSTELDMKEVGRRLAERGVISDLHRFGGTMLYDLPAFAAYRTAACSAAERVFREIVTVPTHEGLTSTDLELIVGAVSASVNGAAR